MKHNDTHKEPGRQWLPWLSSGILIGVVLGWAWNPGISTGISEIIGPPIGHGGISSIFGLVLAVPAIGVLVVFLISRIVLSSRGVPDVTYREAEEMLWSEADDIRVAGVAAVESLMRSHPDEYRARGAVLLGEFIQDSTRGKKSRIRRPDNGLYYPNRPKPSPPDVQAAARALSGGGPQLVGFEVAAPEAASQFGYEKVNLTAADLSGTDFAGVNFIGVRLDGATFSKAILNDVNLHGANLRMARFDGADMRRAKMNSASLNNARFAGADLTDADLNWADLTGAWLAGAKLRRANLWRAKLRDAHIGSADLYRANLDDADLSRSNLAGSILSRVSFSGAILSNVFLSGANLTNAHLEHSVGLTQEMLDGLKPTRPPLSLPEGLIWPFELGEDGEWGPKRRRPGE